jgi:hypothetical protein
MKKINHYDEIIHHQSKNLTNAKINFSVLLLLLSLQFSVGQNIKGNN